VALAFNDCGNFRDQWVRLKVNSVSPCVFTHGIDVAEFPVRHGEGKLCADASIIERLIETNQVVIQYALADGTPAGGRFPDNPNGSLHDIAGICDPTGRIFGLMPHPEAYNHWTNHPDWARNKELARQQRAKPADDDTVGIRMLANAVNYVRQS
jgi:phosphoribosylformylglycinamidine synthase